MVPHKDGKKQYASADDSNKKKCILLDTTPWITTTIKSWKQVYDILEHEIINYPDNSTEEDNESLSAKLRLIAQSKLHKIVAWPRIIPYNDMINWALEHVDIQTRSVINH